MPVTSVRLKDEISRELEATSKREQRSRNWIVNEALRQYLFAASEAPARAAATVEPKAVAAPTESVAPVKQAAVVEKIDAAAEVRKETIAPAASAPASVSVKTISPKAQVDASRAREEAQNASQPWKGVVSWFKHIASDDAESGASNDARDGGRQSPKLRVYEE